MTSTVLKKKKIVERKDLVSWIKRIFIVENTNVSIN